MEVLKIVVYAVVLLFQTPGVLFKLFYYRHQGAKTFKEELLRAGIGPLEAEELTREYRSMLLPRWKELFGLRSRVRIVNE